MSRHHCLFISHILKSAQTTYNVRISGTIVRSEPDAVYLDDATGVIKVTLPDRLRKRPDAHQLLTGSLIDLIGSVKTSHQGQQKWVECRGFSLHSDPIYEILHVLRTIHLQHHYPFAAHLSTKVPATASIATQSMLQPEVMWEPNLSVNDRPDRSGPARLQSQRSVEIEGQARDDDNFQREGSSFDDDLGLGDGDNPLALAIENAIQLSSSGLTLAELRAQFASEAASGDGTIESALEQLIGSGIVYELGGRYCAL